MYQLFAVLISFAIIPILIKKKVKLSWTLLITSGILGILSNIGFKNVLEASLSVFTNPSSRGTVLTIMMVSILGGLMGHYNILKKIVDIMGKVIKNKKNILMIIPAFVGLLVIPGGALLSAPFISRFKFSRIKYYESYRFKSCVCKYYYNIRIFFIYKKYRGRNSI